MGLDIWFKDDLAHILRAVDEANLLALTARAVDIGNAGERTAALREAYHEGFAAALVTVALALGLPAAMLSPASERHVAVRIREVRRAGKNTLLDPPRR